MKINKALKGVIILVTVVFGYMMSSECRGNQRNGDYIISHKKMFKSSAFFEPLVVRDDANHDRLQKYLKAYPEKVVRMVDPVIKNKNREGMKIKVKRRGILVSFSKKF